MAGGPQLSGERREKNGSWSQFVVDPQADIQSAPPGKNNPGPKNPQNFNRGTLLKTGSPEQKLKEGV